MPSWYVYILECTNGAFYTGITNDVQKRFEAHQKGKGAKYTMWFGAEKILYTEKYRNRSRAQKREHEIKCCTRKEKEALIQNK